MASATMAESSSGTRDLGGFRQVAAVLDAGVFGQQLVQGWHAAGEAGQADAEGPEPLAGSVDELFEGPGGAAVGRAEGDELAGDLGAAAPFDVPAG